MYKVGQKIKIKDTDKLISDYLKNSIFKGIDLVRLKLLCQLKEGKDYTISNYCRSCKLVKIKMGKFYLSIKTEHIIELITPNKTT
jgi:hypothetical protein